MIVLNGIVIQQKADGSGFETGFHVVDSIARAPDKPRGGNNEKRMQRPGVFTTLDGFYLDLAENSTNRWLAFPDYTDLAVINEYQ